MIEWIKELESKLDNPNNSGYSKLRKLKEEKFQGNIRINFTSGKISSCNIYDTVKM